MQNFPNHLYAERICWGSCWWWFSRSVWLQTRMARFNGYGRIDLCKTHNPGTVKKLTKWRIIWCCKLKHILVMVELLQASAIRFELRGGEWTEAYMQMDGEPWKQPMNKEFSTFVEIKRVPHHSVMIKGEWIFCPSYFSDFFFIFIFCLDELMLIRHQVIVVQINLTLYVVR